MPLNCTLKNVESGGNSLAAQWLGLCPFTTGVTGSIPSQEIKITRSVWYSQKKKGESGKFYVIYIFYFNKK